MNDQRWENLIKMITSQFDVEDDYLEDIDEEEGGGDRDVIIFNGAVGKIKLERDVRPLVLNKETVYSKRGGSETVVHYEHSEHETTQSLKAYKWNESSEDWDKIDANNFDNVVG